MQFLGQNEYIGGENYIKMIAFVEKPDFRFAYEMPGRNNQE